MREFSNNFPFMYFIITEEKRTHYFCSLSFDKHDKKLVKRNWGKCDP